MFYYPTVLKRHTGCFSTIWLAATKGIKVSRRDYLKVNVKRTCDDIMDYVLVQAPPPLPGLPRPRFSLYLSSQLQYGIIIVYHRQCVFLLEEIQTILDRLTKNRPSQSINLDDYDRQALSMPDFLSLLCESEGAQDPLFGVMHYGEAMPSPSTLIQMRGASPEHPGLTRPAPPLDSLTASPDTITLREREPVIIPTAEFDGVELPDDHPGMIDFLLAQSDHFTEGEAELGREGAAGEEQAAEIEREREGREGHLEREGIKEMTASILELQPSTLSSDDAMVLPPPQQEALTPESRHPSPAEPQAHKRRTKRRFPSLEDLPAPEQRRGRRRRRQLTFFDPETQLSQEVLQQQINDPLIETRPPLLPRPPSHKTLPATDLLNRPCIFLPEELQLLWRQAASITALSGSDLQVGERGPDSTDSERERERKREEAQKDQESHDLSSKEALRAVTESDLSLPDISDQAVLPLEGLDHKELSSMISPLHTPESKGSSVSRSVSRLQGIPEELKAALEREAEEMYVDLPGAMPELAEHDDEPVLFHAMLPPLANRRTVTKTFWMLLENLATRKLCTQQDEPYGAIRILRGPNYEEGDRITSP